MPYKDMPWIRKNEMLYPPSQMPIRVGSSVWFTWLAQAHAFSYQPPGATDRMTVRREQRRHRFYWYAYLKSASKLHNAYVGKSESLTVDRLHQVFDRLLVKVQAQRQRSWHG